MAKSEIKSIQYLRGIAALSVVLFHFLWILNESNQLNIPHLGSILFSNGRAGVDLFFIISGFVMALSSEKNLGRKNNILSFILKRTLRIYPLLFLFVIFVSIKNNTDVNLMLRSLIPLHLNYSSEPPYFGYNILAVAWTLTYELFFYFIFSLSMLINHKFRSLICIFIIFIMLTLSQFYFMGSWSVDPSFSVQTELNGIPKVILSLASSPMMLEFCVGIVSYYIFKHINVVKFSHIIRPLIICSIGLLSIVLISSNIFYGHGILKWGLISFLLLTLFILYEKLFYIKCNSSLKFLGDISYSVYMSHIIVMPYIGSLGKHLSISGFPLITIGIFIVILISTVTYFLIEVPSSVLCRKLISKIIKK